MSAAPVLLFSSLYPSAARSRHGIFVETRLRQLLKVARHDVRVVAPVPWFPLQSGWFGDYARWARTPATEQRHGIGIWHPRYLMVPKLGMRMQPAAMLRAVEPLLRRFARDGWRPKLIDAHYFYPDGVAAVRLGQRLGVPVVVTARGSDINLIAEYAQPRREIVRAAADAAAVVTVSQALRERCVELGIDAAKITVLRNGVDLQMFTALDREFARRQLGLGDGVWLAAVGNLVTEKGFDLAIASLPHLPGARLLVVGEGVEREALAALARRLQVHDRIVWRGAMPQQQLATVYSACDALLLTSRREGWPNVVLEALACGAPVVATDAGAVREILTAAAVGVVVDSRDPRQFAAAVAQTIAGVQRDDCRAHAERFGWAPVSHALAALFDNTIAAATRVDSTAIAAQPVMQ